MLPKICIRMQTVNLPHPTYPTHPPPVKLIFCVKRQTTFWEVEDWHSGSWSNLACYLEYAAFAMTSADGWTFLSPQIRTKNRRPCPVHVLCAAKQGTLNNLRTSRWCGLTLFPKIINWGRLQNSLSKCCKLLNAVWLKSPEKYCKAH